MALTRSCSLDWPLDQARTQNHEVCEQQGHGLAWHRLWALAHRPKSTVFTLDPCKCHFRGRFIICIRNRRTQTSGKERTHGKQ